jgi:hypothetical protein
VIQHAAAMVAWKTFRSGGSGGAAAYDYGSNQRRLLERVDGGGTLWLVTSTRRAREPRKYHLAYKLTDCAAIDPKASMFSGRYDYVVRAGDWRASRHFGFNDATSALRRLRFTSGKPMAEVTNLGLRLLSIPALTSGDVALLERLQHQIEHGRNVFLSYSHQDATIASTIETELGNRDVSVSRDVSMLLPGQRWEDALREEVTGTDCFVVLVSPNSAADNSYVRREVDWALAEYDSGGLVMKILPIVLPEGGWEALPKLHAFQRWDYPARASRPKAFDLLAEGIAARHSKGRRTP